MSVFLQFRSVKPLIIPPGSHYNQIIKENRAAQKHKHLKQFFGQASETLLKQTFETVLKQASETLLKQASEKTRSQMKKGGTR